jgi:hypothetical protein
MNNKTWVDLLHDDEKEIEQSIHSPAGRDSSKRRGTKKIEFHSSFAAGHGKAEEKDHADGISAI